MPLNTMQNTQEASQLALLWASEQVLSSVLMENIMVMKYVRI